MVFAADCTNSRDFFEEKAGFYPYGVQYHRAPTPLPGEWGEDIARIARAGYTHLQLRPQWRWHERIRDQRTWGDLDQLFDLAGTHHLRVILKPMLETAPDWVFSDLGGTRIGFHGIPISPIAHGAYYVGGWWPCFDNPHVVGAATDFVRELISRYVKHPALWFYDAWNEPMSRPMSQCQCCHSIESYRVWLRQRFGTIERLNETYGKAWTSFESVRPPCAAADYAELFLWRQWAEDSVARQVRFVAETIRDCDPDAFILVHSASLAVTQDPIGLSNDDLLTAKETDRYGTSLGIPQHPSNPLEHAASDLQLDWVRRVDPRYWCHEFYPNRDNWCVPTSPQTLERQIWMAIAAGAAGFTFWQYRSERVGCETNGFGLCEIDGSPTPRSESAERIAAILAGPGQILAHTRRVKSRIAILHSRESDMIARIQTMQPRMFDIADEPPSDRYFYKDAIKAAHAVHTMFGHTIEWVVPGDLLGEVDFLHVTACEMIDGATAEWLTEFVERGGTLLVEFPFACRDENTWVSAARPSQGLHRLIGCRESLRSVLQPGQHATFGETKITTKGWKMVLEPMESAEVIALWEDGSAAAVSHRVGKGQVIALGCNLSLAFENRWDDPVRNVFRDILVGKGGYEDPALPDGLWIRRREGDGQEILFAFNVGDETVQLTLDGEKESREWSSSGADKTQSGVLIQPGGFWIAECVAKELTHGVKGQSATRKETALA